MEFNINTRFWETILAVWFITVVAFIVIASGLTYFNASSTNGIEPVRPSKPVLKEINIPENSTKEQIESYRNNVLDNSTKVIAYNTALDTYTNTYKSYADANKSLEVYEKVITNTLALLIKDFFTAVLAVVFAKTVADFAAAYLAKRNS